MRPSGGDGNDGQWKEWKTVALFPTLSTALGNRVAIPTFPSPRLRLVPFPNTQLANTKGIEHEF